MSSNTKKIDLKKRGAEIARIKTDGKLNVLGYDIPDIPMFVDAMEKMIAILKLKGIYK